MTIESMINPVDESEMLVAKGVVEVITFKEIAGGPDKYGNTHRASVKIGDTWINNINIAAKAEYGPQIRYNAGNKAKPDYQTLEKGDEVRMIVTANEYNNKTYYNGSTSKIKLTKKGAGAPAQKPAQAGNTAPASSGSGWKKDTTGVEVGHALNAGAQIVGIEDFDVLLETAKEVHVETIKLKEWYRKANPNMSDYDVGAAAGHAMKMACVPGASAASAASVAKEILSKVVTVLTAYVKGEAPLPAEAEAAKPAPKARAHAVALAPPQPRVVEPEPDFGDDDFDDQAPF